MIGNRVLFDQETRDLTGATVQDIELDWNDANVQILEGDATGVVNVFLPNADQHNSFGEVWILNKMDVAHAKMRAVGESGNVTNNVLNDMQIGLTPGQAAICRYVANSQDRPAASTPSTGEENWKRGGWIILHAGS